MIDWAALSRREHDVAFKTLAKLHEDLNSQSGQEPTRTPGLYAACHHITTEMHRANDDLARRETAVEAGDLSALR